MKQIPEIKITVDCDGESVTHKIKGEANLNRYKEIFKSILRFNGFKDDVIKKQIGL